MTLPTIPAVNMIMCADRCWGAALAEQGGWWGGGQKQGNYEHIFPKFVPCRHASTQHDSAESKM